MINYKMVHKTGEINAHTSSQGNQNRREEGRGEQETDGVLRNVGGSTERGGAKSKKTIQSNRKGRMRRLESSTSGYKTKL